jgi:hypothetical protein
MGVSIRTRAGEYCRTFTLCGPARRDSRLAGLACREHGTWQVDVLALGKARAPGSYRMAGSELPKAVLQALEDKIVGEPRDAAGEAAAREQRWQP